MKNYKSDKVIGQHYATAVKWIDREDLWDEVVDLITDAYGIVTAVVH